MNTDYRHCQPETQIFKLYFVQVINPLIYFNFWTNAKPNIKVQTLFTLRSFLPIYLAKYGYDDLFIATSVSIYCGMKPLPSRCSNRVLFSISKKQAGDELQKVICAGIKVTRPTTMSRCLWRVQTKM